MSEQEMLDIASKFSPYRCVHLRCAKHLSRRLDAVNARCNTAEALQVPVHVVYVANRGCGDASARVARGFRNPSLATQHESWGRGTSLHDDDRLVLNISVVLTSSNAHAGRCTEEGCNTSDICHLPYVDASRERAKKDR